MKPEMCIACRTPNNFRTTEWEVSHICKRLATLTGRYELTQEEEQFARTLLFDRKFVHAFCGSCHKINDNVLRRTEDEIDEHLAYIACRCEKSVLEQALRCIAGHYSGKYQAVEREWLKRHRNIKEDKEN